VIAIAIVFVFGLGTTVYLSLRSPEVKVPEIVGKDRFEAERVLANAGLNFRVRAVRPNAELKANTVLFQLPRAGDVVKAGQTVAMDISRTAKEGESSEAIPQNTPEEKPAIQNTNEPANENKPKRNKNTNKNDNANANANAGNRNANSNRPSINRNANANTNGTNANSNVKPLIINNNANRSSNQNSNVRPPAPKASPVSKPVSKPTNENP